MASAAPVAQHLKQSNVVGLGYGYDISKGVDYSDGLREPLFDLQVRSTRLSGEEDKTTSFDLVRSEAGAPGQPETLVRSRVVPIAASHHSYRRIFGKSSEEYLDSLRQEMKIEGEYKAFGASASRVTNAEDIYKHSRSKLTIRCLHALGGFQLPAGYEDFVFPHIRKMLDDPAKPAEEIFRRLGTHFLYRVVLGGFAECNIDMKSASLDKVRDVEHAVKGTFKCATEKGSAEASASEKEKRATAISSNTEDALWSASGGDKLVSSETDLGPWAEGIKDWPVICDVPAEGFVPIWSLCTDPGRRETLATAAKVFLDKIPKPAPAIRRGLIVQEIERAQCLFSDRGSSCADDLSIYAPLLDQPYNDYFMLGHVAVGTHDRVTVRTMIVKDPKEKGDSLKKPLRVERVWHSEDVELAPFSFWRMVPPKGYQALGDIYSPSWNEPDTSRMRCVHDDLVEPARIAGGKSIWCNKISVGGLAGGTGGHRGGGLLGGLSRALTQMFRREPSAALRVGAEKVELFLIEPANSLDRKPLNLFRAEPNWEKPTGKVHTLQAGVSN